MNKPGGNRTVMIAIAIAVVVVAGAITGWIVVSSGGNPPAANQSPVAGVSAPKTTTEWSRISSPDGSFTAYFPGGPQAPVEMVEKAADQFGPRTQTWTQRVNNRSYIANLMTYEPQFAGASKPEIVAKVTGYKTYTAETTTTLSGRKAKRFITTSGKYTQATVTAGLGDGRTLIFTVLDDTPLTFEDPIADQFFAKIEIAAGAIPPAKVLPGEWPSQTLTFKSRSVSLSAPLTLQQSPTSGLPLKGVSQRFWKAQSQSGKAPIYTLMIIESPAAQGGDLDQLCDGFVKTMNFGKEQTRAPVMLGGHPGRKMMFTSGGSDIHYQATIIGSNVITLTVAGTSPFPENDPDAAKFFASVQIK